MAGVRERQKHRRSEEIRSTALHLFVEKGFDRTTIEDVADRAVVAAGTVYNYFGTKDGILRQIIARHVADRREERQAFLANPPHSLQKAVAAFVDLLLDSSLDDLNKDIWRQVLACAPGRSSDTNNLLQTVTSAIVEQFQGIYEILQERGELDAETSAQDLAEASMAVTDFHFYRMVCDAKMSIADTKTAIKRQLEIVLRGCTQGSTEA